MARDTKILQMLLEGQSLIRREMKEGFEKVTNRMDKLGLQLAELEDDTPTIEEFEKLEKKVTKVQHHLALG